MDVSGHCFRTTAVDALVCFGVFACRGPYSKCAPTPHYKSTCRMNVCGHCFRITAVAAVVCFDNSACERPSPLPHHLTRALDGWTSVGTASEPQQWMLLCVLEGGFQMFIFQVCSHTTSREHLMDGRLRALLQNHSSGCCCVFMSMVLETFIFQVCSHTTSREHSMDGRLRVLLQNHDAVVCFDNSACERGKYLVGALLPSYGVHTQAEHG